MEAWERHTARRDALADNNYIDAQEADAQSRAAFFAIADEFLVGVDREHFIVHYNQPSTYDLADVISMYDAYSPQGHRIVVRHGALYRPQTFVFPIVGDRFEGRWLALDNGRLVAKLL